MKLNWKHNVFLPEKVSRKRLKSNRFTCTSKVSYKTAEEAEDRALEMMETETVYRMQPYQCAACTFFHVGGVRQRGGGKSIQPRYLYHERPNYGRIAGRPTTEARVWIQARRLQATEEDGNNGS